MAYNCSKNSFLYMYLPNVDLLFLTEYYHEILKFFKIGRNFEFGKENNFFSEKFYIVFFHILLQ